VDDPTLTVPMDALTITVRLQAHNGGRPTLRLEDSGEDTRSSLLARGPSGPFCGRPPK